MDIQELLAKKAIQEATLKLLKDAGIENPAVEADLLSINAKIDKNKGALASSKAIEAISSVTGAIHEQMKSVGLLTEVGEKLTVGIQLTVGEDGILLATVATKTRKAKGSTSGGSSDTVITFNDDSNQTFTSFADAARHIDPVAEEASKSSGRVLLEKFVRDGKIKAFSQVEKVSATPEAAPLNPAESTKVQRDGSGEEVELTENSAPPKQNKGK
jgi:hypothetical protein